MAKTEKADGKYGPATKLADDVITAQTAEIEQMNEMLGKSWPATEVVRPGGEDCSPAAPFPVLRGGRAERTKAFANAEVLGLSE